MVPGKGEGGTVVKDGVWVDAGLQAGAGTMARSPGVGVPGGAGQRRLAD